MAFHFAPAYFGVVERLFGPTNSSKMNDFLFSGRRRDIPIPLRVFGPNELTVMLKHQMCARVSELERERTGIVESREVV